MPRAPRLDVRSLSCPSCGGTVELRGYKHTRSAVCIQCLAVLDTTTPELAILEKMDERLRVRPLLPLGKRGRWRGVDCQVLGFQVRTITVEGTDYSWHEYLLFNPFQGFRYLTQYDGHWNDVTVLDGLPEPATARGRRAAAWGGRIFAHFQRSTARTTFVMGEFPWQVKTGDSALVDDFIAPPLMLSSEVTAGETTWSLGDYTAGALVWQAFSLPGQPPPATGIYANQPSNAPERARNMWRTSLWLLLLWAVLFAGFTFSVPRARVFHGDFHFVDGQPGEHSFVTGAFEINGRTSPVDVKVQTNLENDWAVVSLALINEQTGQGFDAHRQISFYHGVDGGESWSEGGRNDSFTISQVPAGRYYLRIEPDMEDEPVPGAARRAMDYTVTLTRGAAGMFLFWLALPLLLLPPVFASFGSLSFESRRWQESDYAPQGGGGE